MPDGDTGTNMALTLESVVAELDARRRHGRVCKAISHGSLMGARGNSGVILSQILRGLADGFCDHDEASSRRPRAGARGGRPTPRTGRCMRPVEGTILTVVREAAEAAEAAATGEKTLVGVLDARRAPRPGQPSSARPSCCPC